MVKHVYEISFKGFDLIIFLKMDFIYVLAFIIKDVYD